MCTVANDSSLCSRSRNSFRICRACLCSAQCRRNVVRLSSETFRFGSVERAATLRVKTFFQHPNCAVATFGVALSKCHTACTRDRRVTGLVETSAPTYRVVVSQSISLLRGRRSVKFERPFQMSVVSLGRKNTRVNTLNELWHLDGENSAAPLCLRRFGSFGGESSQVSRNWSRRMDLRHVSNRAP